jgi:aerobic-type carbon monoxide dehydrogenase small subunit (CoxS/CutS family)
MFRRKKDGERPPDAERGESARGEPTSPSKLTRRHFLAGTGVTAATTVTLEACGPEHVNPVGVKGVGPGPVPVTLHVNGVERQVEVEPRATLADVLRVELGLTGTKVGCDRGACSSCTVWIDDAPVCACMMFVLDAVGQPITTIEGLASGDALHPVQQAFIDHDATQCGFCTPGMIMSCAALLQRNPSPTLDDVRAATSGNLCRCGTYPKVFKATLAAASAGAAGKGG